MESGYESIWRSTWRISIMRNWMIASAASGEVFNPEEGLSLTSITSPFSGFSLGSGENNAVFAGEIEFPNPLSACVLFEIGGRGQGSYLGILPDNTNFVIRAGDGASDNGVSRPGKAEAIFDATSLAGLSGTIVWEFRVDGRVSLWFNGQLIAQDTAANNEFENNQYAGGDAGGWGIIQSGVSGDGSTTNWTGSLLSDMRFYQGQNVIGV